ncbi:Uncharacterised protein [Mycobacteroides abscessus subsp. abscessus]|uniref:hypothetical protein n=1 Tax=Mycobacteroides abscessus TaxID=36809 RepID=UPI0009285F71|nr:hypothetical protein [Mycobacteroides abscessus]SII93394.1 Uncharacterised protein [Mycobacteroides abscessus subsp. abscessus]SIL07857.1 Uncharacterised protein [Mycobacteroides abscessus subsp. abscessus]SLK58480.1 Uncharacterised protein [Mycobacteroides abscessus subsp. abscessus]
MLDRFFAALAAAIGNAVFRVLDKKIPDNIADKLIDRGLQVLGEIVDRAADRVADTAEATADRIAGSAEAELGQLGSEIRGVVKAANPIDILGSLFGRR